MAGALACAAVRAWGTPGYDAAFAALEDVDVVPATLAMWRQLDAAHQVVAHLDGDPREVAALRVRLIGLLAECEAVLFDGEEPPPEEAVRAQLDRAAAFGACNRAFLRDDAERMPTGVLDSPMATPYEPAINTCLERPLPRQTGLERLRAVRAAHPEWRLDGVERAIAEHVGVARHAAWFMLPSQAELPLDLRLAIARMARGLSPNHHY